MNNLNRSGIRAIKYTGQNKFDIRDFLIRYAGFTDDIVVHKGDVNLGIPLYMYLESNKESPTILFVNQYLCIINNKIIVLYSFIFNRKYYCI